MRRPRVGQMSTPMKVVIVLVIVLSVAALILAAVRPNVLGLSGETNESIFSAFRQIGEIIDMTGGG